MKNILFLVIGSVGLLATGCTSKQPQEKPIVIEMQKVPIASIPMGAEVRVDGKLIGVTPTAADLQKNQNHIVTLSKDGYLPKNILVFSKRDEARAITQAFTSVLKDNVVDPVTSAENSWKRGEASGETFYLEPNYISVDLTQDNSASK